MRKFSIGIIGAGVMGKALAANLLKKKITAPKQLLVCDTDNKKLANQKKRLGIVACTDAAVLATRADYIVLAVKPQDDNMKRSLEQNLAKVKKTSVLLAQTTGAKRNRFLLLLGKALPKEKNLILRANEIDAQKLSASDPMRDRLLLTEKRITGMAAVDRKDINHLLTLRQYLDIVIPRGGQGLIDFVRAHSSIPVIETGAGVCHIYIDKGADIKQAARLVHNAKTSRPSVCNALDALLIHRDPAKAALREFTRVFAGSGVIVAADATSYRLLKQAGYQPLRRAKTDDFGTEFLRLEMAIKIVPDLNTAISHINAFGFGHSEAILSKNKQNIARFFREVDAACVYANASTRFTDGGEFGLGGEVGISTQKLHARGPLGARELTTYKWLIRGQGQIRQ